MVEEPSCLNGMRFGDCEWVSATSTTTTTTSSTVHVHVSECYLSAYELEQEDAAGVYCCGTEGDDCACPGLVRMGTYGLDWQGWQELWSDWQEADGAISCSSGSFGGDPAPGFAKICECQH